MCHHGAPVTTNGRAAWTADLTLLGDDALEEVNRLWTIAQVLSNTAHAVKNSLQVTGGNAELIESRDGLDPALLRRVQTIRAQAMRAADALDSLMLYSRATAPSVEPVEVGALMTSAMEMRSHSLGRARILSEVRAADGGPCVALARRRDLLQLFLNVLLAVEVALAGRAGAKIVVRLSRRASDIFVEVIGEGASAASVSHGPADDFGIELQRRVMDRLASGLGAALSSDFSRDSGPVFSVVLPTGENAGRQPGSSWA